MGFLFRASIEILRVHIKLAQDLKVKPPSLKTSEILKQELFSVPYNPTTYSPLMLRLIFVGTKHLNHQ